MEIAEHVTAPVWSSDVNVALVPHPVKSNKLLPSKSCRLVILNVGEVIELDSALPLKLAFLHLKVAFPISKRLSNDGNNEALTTRFVAFKSLMLPMTTIESVTVKNLIVKEPPNKSLDRL